MDPIFTLPYSEYFVANFLSDNFKKRDGYSIYVPISRQEKGVDLILSKRVSKKTKIAAIQIRSSRTYITKPPKRQNIERYTYATWFNRFDVQDESDFYILVGFYPEKQLHGHQASERWWSSMVLLFTNHEMINFISNVKTKTGKPDKMFGFSFNNTNKIVLTRGDEKRRNLDYSKHLLINRKELIHSRMS